MAALACFPSVQVADNLDIADIYCHWGAKWAVVPAAGLLDFVDILVLAAGMAAGVVVAVLDFDKAVFENVLVDPGSCQLRACSDPADPDAEKLDGWAP